MTSPATFAARLAIAAVLASGPAAAFAKDRSAGAPVSVLPGSSEAATFELVAATDFGSGSGSGSDGAAEGESTAAARPSQASGKPSTQSDDAPARRGFPMPDIVIDETWLSIGVGAGLVPSYGGSDDYIVFPLPLIVGRVGGVGIRPNGPGFRLDVLSPAPSLGGNAKKPVFNFGPAFRFRNDRAQQVKDPVVKLAQDLDIALEIGLVGGVTFGGVFHPLDSVSFDTQVRTDVLGAHDGVLVEPSIDYSRPFGPGVLVQASVGAQFVDDNFADYYYTVTPVQSAATGLPLFTADGGLNSISSTAIVNFDLDGNALNGGLSIYSVLGYTRFVGDAADTPFTDIRGNANQFIGGVGVAYTF